MYKFIQRMQNDYVGRLRNSTKKSMAFATSTSGTLSTQLFWIFYIMPMCGTWKKLPLNDLSLLQLWKESLQTPEEFELSAMPVIVTNSFFLKYNNGIMLGAEYTECHRYFLSWTMQIIKAILEPRIPTFHTQMWSQKKSPIPLSQHITAALYITQSIRK